MVKEKYEYILKRGEKHLPVADSFFIACFILLFGLVRSDYLLIGAYVCTILYSIATRRQILIRYLAVATILGAAWTTFAKDIYGYNHNFLMLGDINIFPLLAWSLGLFGVYLIYRHIESHLGLQHFFSKFLLFIILYWPILIFGETIAYHVFHIHNIASAQYTGLPFCNCLHAPTWMKVVYFAMGPLFFLLCSVLQLQKTTDQS